MTVDNTTKDERDELTKEDRDELTNDDRDELTDDARDELTKDEVFKLLNSSRRRHVLYLLDNAPEGMSISELTDRVAAWEEGSTVETLVQKERKRVYVSLYQTHLPKMDDMGIIEFDRDSGTVTLTLEVDRIRRFLPAKREGPSWALYYLTLAVAGLAVYSSKFWGLIDGIPWPVIAVLMYGGFVLVTVGYYRSVRSSRGQFEDFIADP